MRLIFISIFLFLIHLLSFGQDKLYSQKYSFGIWMGTSAYSGDVTPAYPNIYKVLRPAAGIYNRINFNERISLKTAANAGTLYGDDQLSDNIYNKYRNLSFRTRIFELSTQLEFNFFKFILNSDYDNVTPYFFLGVAGFYFNPQAEYNGEWVDLQPLGTEGQQFPQYSGNEPYSRFDWGIVYGGGLKLSIDKGFTMGLEVGYRTTTTDYLDDISTTYIDNDVIAAGRNGGLAAALADRSPDVAPEPIGLEDRQRGNADNYDHYLFMGVNFAFTFRKMRCPNPSNSLFEKW